MATRWTILMAGNGLDYMGSIKVRDVEMWRCGGAVSVMEESLWACVYVHEGAGLTETGHWVRWS